ncbi:MAG: hypothetical protein ACE5LB_03785 [Acidiferrobacterales bacterium]
MMGTRPQFMLFLVTLGARFLAHEGSFSGYFLLRGGILLECAFAGGHEQRGVEEKPHECQWNSNDKKEKKPTVHKGTKVS